ncbi:MAG: hypothetical protein CMO55_28650 [Verrucomicrobiales bacterium]|nr:hypothetical protein [Verrucomicrobiales bacterium]
MKIPKNLVRDSIGSATLCMLSCGIGLAANLLREDPLELAYVAPGGSFGLVKELGDWRDGVHRIEVGITKELVEKRGALILDARPDLFYEFGHIPGALNLSRKNFEAELPAVEEKLGRAKELGVPVVVYCAHKHCEDASIVASRILEKGERVILIYEGGYDEWEGLGLRTAEGR